MIGHEHLRGIAGVDRDAITARQAEEKGRAKGPQQVGRLGPLCALQCGIHRDERLPVYVEKGGLKAAAIFLHGIHAGNVEVHIGEFAQQIVAG